MENAEQTLVVILASALAILLVLSIVAVVKFIQILKTVKNILESAEDLAQKAETLGGIFRKSAGPIALGRLLVHIAETVFRSNESGSKRRKRG